MIKALFVSHESSPEPWYTDVAEALADLPFELVSLDEARPLAVQFEGATMVIDNGGHGTREMIDAAANAGVVLWQALTTGLDHTDVDYIRSRGIRLANTPGEFSSVALAEHALMLMLCLEKQLKLSQLNLARGMTNEPINGELNGRRLGLIGLGRSGRELARRAGSLGMRICAVDELKPTSAELEDVGVEWCEPPTALYRLLAESDHISVHVPLTAKTRHLIGEAELRAMKTTAFLINVARGEIVDEAALLDALRTGAIAGAGLDVFAVEPPDPEHPLLQLPNVVATPHVAGVTRGTSRRRAAASAENARRLAEGEPLLHEISTQ
jgi:phosphoglycerate dehydrogenase-like enzyme